jgi:hypothetical protein
VAPIVDHAALSWAYREKPTSSAPALEMTKLPRGKLVGPEPEDEAEHFRKCEKCGALYDMRDLDAVFAHDGPLPHPK